MSSQGQLEKAVHVTVSGHVQGVGFRFFTVQRARRHGLVGWVRNLADGRVELVAEGPAEAVAALVRDVQAGPQPGLVAGCEVEWQPPCHRFGHFDITY
ncbi:MAG: acylphosphatase [Gemmatimonadota bacterium]